MKILYVVHSFPPHNVAGTEIYTYNLCSELSKRHEIFVFHRVNDRGKEEYEVNYTGSGFHVYSINNTFRDCDSYEKIYKNEEIARRFGNLLDKIQPDVVHIQHLLFLSTTILDEVKSRNIPIVYTLNDYWLICPQAQFLRRNFQICNLDDELDCVDCQIFELNITENKKRIYSRLRKSYPSAARFLKKAYLYCVRPFSLLSKENKTKIRSRRDHIAFAIKRVDIFISPSKFLADKFIRLGLDPAKVIISAYGFNQEPFKNLKKKVNGGNITFGFIGTLLPHKGLDVLIKAFNEIENRNTELRIYGKVYPYAGYEYYPEHLKKLVKNKQIRFMGAFDNNRISGIFS
jgi:glycosyltransferase involved in cell wall biosynthesis